MREEAINAGAKGNSYGLSIAERFYLLAVIIESTNPDEVNKAYGLLTNIRGKKYTTDYIKDICAGVDFQRKYNKKGPPREKLTDEERERKKREYYIANREKVKARTRKWRADHSGRKRVRRRTKQTGSRKQA